MTPLLVLCWAVAQAARPPTDYRVVLATDLAEQAAALNSARKYQEAVALVERFQSAVEPMAPVSYEAGYALNRLGQPEAALEHYSTAIEQDPRLASARYDRGELYLSLQRWSDASADFEVVCQVRPGHWAGHFRMAQLAGVSVDPDAMEQHLIQAISTGFDLKILPQDPAWLGFARDPELALVLRKIIVLYGNESLLTELGLQP
jgi:tetratricopeptide (TPR) repeat protein